MIDAFDSGAALADPQNEAGAIRPSVSNATAETRVSKMAQALVIADLTIEDLALSEAVLLERVAELECDNSRLREAFHVALSLLHDAQAQVARLRATVIRAHEAYRSLRKCMSGKAESR